LGAKPQGRSPKIKYLSTKFVLSTKFEIPKGTVTIIDKGTYRVIGTYNKLVLK
jgi:hypothetical protein